MNLADYLSELLAQQEEVSVPGLGCFVRERVNGYYNDREARFYPPHHRVKFVQENRDDDTFAQYIAEKKNITLASSKYFAEKFVSKLMEQASNGKCLFADLGLFYVNKGQLLFKPNEKIADDPSFYGLGIINAHKVTEELPAAGYIDFEPVPPKPVDLAGKQQVYEEGLEGGSAVSIWMILFLGLVALVIAVFGIHKFYPAAFTKVAGSFHMPKMQRDNGTAVSPLKPRPKAETTKAAAPPHDTTIKPVAVVVQAPVTRTDTAAKVAEKLRFAVILHDKYRKIKDAVAEVNYLKSLGLKAAVLPPMIAPGPLYKISFKECATEAEASQYMLTLVNEGKINKDLELFPLTIR